MGLTELVQRWESGSSWKNTLSEWQSSREHDLPQLHSIIDRFQAGAISASEFRAEMDAFSQATHYAGFHGTGGQMFLNLLVKNAKPEELESALRAALPTPTDEADAY